MRHDAVESDGGEKQTQQAERPDHRGPQAYDHQQAIRAQPGKATTSSRMSR